MKAYKLGAVQAAIRGGKHLGSKLNALQWFTDYLSRVEDDSGAVESDSFSTSIYKLFYKRKLQADMKLAIIAEGGLKTRTSGVEKYVTKAYDLSDSDIDPVQTTENSQPFLGGRIAPNEIQNFKSVTGGTKTLAHTDIVVSGTYTIIKVLNAEDSGKTVVSFTEVSSGTYNSISWTGKLYAYMIYGGTISSANQALIEADLLDLVIDSIQIDIRKWNTSNFEGINNIKEMQLDTATEKVTNGGFDTDTGWTKSGAVAIDGGVCAFSGIGYIYKGVPYIADKWFKITYTVLNYVSDSVFFYAWGAISVEGTRRKANGTFTEFIKIPATSTNNIGIRTAGATLNVDNASFVELGWADSEELYNGLITQGFSVANALKEVANYCYHNNDISLGEIYGKIYNGFAKTQIVNDIETQENFGFHIATETELISLAEKGGYKLKVDGTDYWNTDNGTNETGFTALGGGTRSDVDGSFNTIKSTTAFWCADADKVLVLNHADNSATITAVNKGYGAYIRLVKNEVYTTGIAPVADVQFTELTFNDALGTVYPDIIDETLMIGHYGKIIKTRDLETGTINSIDVSLYLTNNILFIEKIWGDEYLIAEWTVRDELSPNNPSENDVIGGYWKTSGGLSGTLTKVIIFKNRYITPKIGWCIDKGVTNELYYTEYGGSSEGQYDEVGEVGTKGRATCAYRSTDNGSTWTKIFDIELLTDLYPLDGQAHIHSVHFDTVWNRIWITTGDGSGITELKTKSNKKLAYSDDYGTTWNAVELANYFNTQTVDYGTPFDNLQLLQMYSDENVLLAFSDSFNQGIYRVIKRGKNEVPVLENVYKWNEINDAITHYSSQMFRGDATQPIIIAAATSGESAEEECMFIATWDGVDFYKYTPVPELAKYWIQMSYVGNGKYYMLTKSSPNRSDSRFFTFEMPEWSN